MRIYEIEGSEDPLVEAFIAFPWKIDRLPQAWVPPIKFENFLTLSKKHNLFFRHGDAAFFLAMDGNEVLGRISASYDDSLFSGDRSIGHFGFFECVDDANVARALLQAAEAWLMERGKTDIYGPVNLNIFAGYRIQLSGFDKPAFMGEPRSPAYYQDLLEHCGYAVSETWRSWDMPEPVLPIALDGLKKQVASYDSAIFEGLRYRYFSPETADEDWRLAHGLVMETFKDNFHCPNMDADEFVQVTHGPAMTDPGSFMVENPEGELIAFAWGYVDRSEALRFVDGDIQRIDSLGQFPSNCGVLNAFGIKDSYRKTGLANVILSKVFQYLVDQKFERVIGALAKEGRTVYEALGGPSRSYGVCKKTL